MEAPPRPNKTEVCNRRLTIDTLQVGDCYASYAQSNNRQKWVGHMVVRCGSYDAGRLFFREASNIVREKIYSQWAPITVQFTITTTVWYSNPFSLSSFSVNQIKHARSFFFFFFFFAPFVSCVRERPPPSFWLTDVWFEAEYPSFRPRPVQTGSRVPLSEKIHVAIYSLVARQM